MAGAGPRRLARSANYHGRGIGNGTASDQGLTSPQETMMGRQGLACELHEPCLMGRCGACSGA